MPAHNLPIGVAPSSEWFIKADNAHLRAQGTPRHVVSWELVGAHYWRGRKMPGFVRVHFNGGGYKWFPEDTPLLVAFDACDALGYDTEDARTKLDEWVRTGKGATFSLY